MRSKEKTLSNFFVLTVMIMFCACNGPRYVYSVSPLASPVPMQEGATSAELSYFGHNKTSSDFNSGENKDKAVGFTLSHMKDEHNMLFVTGNIKSEQNIFPLISDSASRVLYNGGFDSSFIETKRFSAGTGITHFFDPLNAGGTIIPGIGGSLNLDHMNLTESGKLKSDVYHRFLKMYQLSFLVQYNLLFKISSRFNLAYVGRFSLVKFFKAKTDYTADEKYYLGFARDGKTEFYSCFISGYADFTPVKHIPFTLTCQLFNDFVFRNKLFAKSNPGGTNLKGSGAAIGMKYTF